MSVHTVPYRPRNIPAPPSIVLQQVLLATTQRVGFFPVLMVAQKFVLSW